MDYYDLLGVKRSASADELKTAYKRQAMKNHPDKGGDPEKFKQINEAYQALSDPQQKQMYDQFGTTDPQQAQMHRGGFQYSNMGGNEFDDILKHFGFGMHFGNGFANQRSRRNKDIKFYYKVAFKEIFTGKTDTVSYKLGSGRTEILDVRIPPGISDGDNIKFENYGDDSVQNLQRGDLIIIVKIEQDPNFRRQGADLYTTLNVNIFDLILGTKKKILTPIGKEIELKIPPNTNPNTTFSVTGQGVPLLRSNMKGKLFVQVQSFYPKLTAGQLEKLKNLKNELDI